MKTTFATAAAALFCLAVPALAESHGPDLTATTCADFAKMDKDGMMAVTDAVDSMKMMEGKSEAEVMKMKEEMATMTDEQKAEHMKMAEESMTMLMDHCKGMDAMTVMEVSK